jgi:hypothetical protein
MEIKSPPAMFGSNCSLKTRINGHQARVLYSSGKTTNGRMDVPIAEPGSYCLGFSNAFSLLSAKNIAADIELQYLTR